MISVSRPTSPPRRLSQAFLGKTKIPRTKKNGIKRVARMNNGRRGDTGRASSEKEWSEVTQRTPAPYCCKRVDKGMTMAVCKKNKQNTAQNEGKLERSMRRIPEMRGSGGLHLLNTKYPHVSPPFAPRGREDARPSWEAPPRRAGGFPGTTPGVPANWRH